MDKLDRARQANVSQSTHTKWRPNAAAVVTSGQVRQSQAGECFSEYTYNGDQMQQLKSLVDKLDRARQKNVSQSTHTKETKCTSCSH